MQSPRRPRVTPRRRARTVLLVMALVAVVLLAVAPVAFAGAGGGSAGFTSGGGGGGGGGGGHSAFEIYIVVRLLILLVVTTHGFGLILVAAVAAWWWYKNRGGEQQVKRWMAARQRQGRSHKRETKKRERKVSLAAAEAEDQNPIFGPSAVRDAAAELFTEIQLAWSADNRVKLRGLITPELAVEWERRLDDFDRKGWSNKVEPVGAPTVEYVGLERKNSHNASSADRVVVRVEAKLRDYVVDRQGRHIKKDGSFTETTRMREYWTLERRGNHWVLASIESGGEGGHALKDKVVQTEWADDQALRDEAMVEGANAEKTPAGMNVADLADLQFTGDAQAAAMDLSLADARFAPDILEIAARRAVSAWAVAVDGPNTELRKLASPEAVSDLLHPGDPSEKTRLVVRGVSVQRIRVVGLDAAATPPAMTIDVDLRGRRYIEERDTTRVLLGSPTRLVGFTERWTLSLSGDDAQPWRIATVQTPLPTA